MPTDQRRAAARRRAWGRGPCILRFEPLEGRQLLTASTTLPDLAGQSFQIQPVTQAPALNWGDAVDVKGVVVNNGGAATASSFQVELYASPTPGLGQGAVALGAVTLPAGLQPGGQAPFEKVVNLPATALAGVTTPGAIYVGMAIDPNNQVAGDDKQNNFGVGPGYDLALVDVAARTTANLVGTALQVSPGQTEWGGALTVTQQITNTGTAASPPTRALIILTPTGGANDVTVGFINVPAIPAGQSTQVTQTVKLPATAPSGFTGNLFTVSLVQDADYATSPIYPHMATQGAGADQARVTIDAPPYAGAVASASLPTLNVLNVKTPTTNIQWGQSFQVSATVQNLGAAESGGFRLRFLLMGNDGTLSNGLFLADVAVPSLKPGYSQDITQTVKLPATLPNGQSLNSLGVASIAVVADPEHTFDQTSRAGTVAFSPVLSLKVVGAGGQTSVPTTAPAATTTTVKGVKAAAAKSAAAAKTAAAKAAVAAKASQVHNKVYKARPIPHTFQHDLKVFPKKASDYLQKVWKNL